MPESKQHAPSIEQETGPTANEAAADLLRIAGLDPAIVSRLTVTGSEPILPAIFRIGTAGAAVIGAAALAVTEAWRERTGREQTVSISKRDAVASYHSDRWAVVENGARRDRGDRVGLSFYRTKDGRWMRFQTSLPHHRQAVLDVLGCEDTRASGIIAVAQWDSHDLEEAIAAKAGIPAIVLSPEEWANHPQGKAVQAMPVLKITKIADGPPQPFGPGDRPLDGIRVIDITRVISGPTCCRFLAGHGANVLQLSSMNVADWGVMDIATGFGKRSAWLDLNTEAEQFGKLVDETDVLVQGMRPGVLAGFGFSPEAAAARRPGIVYVSLSGFGHDGPWASRAVYDSMLQCHNGMAYEGSLYREDGEPTSLPCQVMDHSTAYMAALGAVAALIRRAREGGSYHVEISLATSGEWVKRLGRVDGLGQPSQEPEMYQDRMAVMDTPYGKVHYVLPAEQLSETPAFYARPSAPFGLHQPTWDPTDEWSG